MKNGSKNWKNAEFTKSEGSIIKKTGYTKLIIIPLIICAANAGAQDFPAELMLRAFYHCYPEKTGAPVFMDGDWTVRTGKETYYWAEGRLLPRALKDEKDAFTPHVFEIYPDTIVSPSSYSDQFIESLRIHGSIESLDQDNQHHGFQGVLYGGLARREIENRLQKISFLGTTISVNRDIAAALSRIDAQIMEAGASDTSEGKQISLFLDSIGQIGGYNWREIRSSSRMSYHSWGLAVDIQPKNPGNSAIYWLWERSRNRDWMLVPLNARWKPPDRVIEAFEQEGFIWGGKWAMYDTMHFEYRPELHELNRLLSSADGSYSITGVSGPAATRDLHHLYPDNPAPKSTGVWSLPLLPRRKDSPARPAK